MIALNFTYDSDPGCGHDLDMAFLANATSLLLYVLPGGDEVESPFLVVFICERAVDRQAVRVKRLWVRQTMLAVLAGESIVVMRETLEFLPPGPFVAEDLVVLP